MRGMIRDCLIELKDRKVIYIYALLVLIVVVGTVASRMFEIHIQGMTIGADKMNRALGNPMLRGYTEYMYILVFLTVMSTAGLIPAMLKRGRADFYLSKPVSRTWLLLTRMASIWVVYGAVMVVAFLMNYVVSAGLYSVFSFKILYIIVINLLTLMIWLSITAFAGILTGSAAHSIIAAFSVWLVQKILHFHDFPKQFVDSKLVTYAIDALYYVFPKTGEISDLTGDLVRGGASSWMPLYSSLIFAGVLTVVTVLIFKRKEY